MSARRVDLGRPVACSGAMYCGVPLIMPVAVSLLEPSSIFAMPKSARYTRSSSSSRMFCGFTSRWTSLLPWA